MSHEYLDFNDPTARYPLDLLPHHYRDLVEHLHGLGQMQLIEEGERRYVTWTELNPYLPPHP